jgi:hypothetical protein
MILHPWEAVPAECRATTTQVFVGVLSGAREDVTMGFLHPGEVIVMTPPLGVGSATTSPWQLLLIVAIAVLVYVLRFRRKR